MAGPVDPTEPINALTVSTEKLTDAQMKQAAAQKLSSDETIDAANSYNIAGNAINSLASAYEALERKAENAQFELKKNGELSKELTTVFGLLSTAALGSQKAFQGQNFSGSNVNAFTDQISFLTSKITESNGGVAALKNIALSTFGAIIPNSIENTVGAVKNYIINLAQNADNATKLQSAMVSLAGKTGGLGEIYKKAGPTLANMNSLLYAQQDMMNKTATSTHLGTEEIRGYYMQLGSIPKALNETVKHGEAGNSTISMLTATIQAAKGSGREYSEIIDDMHKAFKVYGITGEDALKFTLRFNEISNKFGIDLEDVKSGLMGAAGSLGVYADAGEHAAKMSEGLAAVMNEDLGKLMDAGMTGKGATDAIQQRIKSMSELGLAQKAFMSSQTGGPGGMRGAYQIEQMLRDGRGDEVLKKQMDTIKRLMGGRIVTLQEAQSSDVDAAQMTKQIAFLKQGPMGAMVKNDQDAFKMFDAMRGVKSKELSEKSGEKLGESVIKDSVDMGTRFQEKTATEISRVRSILESMQNLGGISNKDLLEQKFTASGQGEEGKLRAEMLAARAKGGAASTELKAKFKEPDELADKGGVYTAEAVNMGLTVVNDIKNLLGIGKKSSIDTKSDLDEIQDEISAKRENAKSMKNDMEKQKALLEIEENQKNLNSMRSSSYNYSSPNSLLGNLNKLQTSGVVSNQTNATQGNNSGTSSNPIEVNVSKNSPTGKFIINVQVDAQEVNNQSNGIAPGSGL